MVKRLRKSFITVAMSAVLVVLVLLNAAINIGNYLSSDRESSQILETISRFQGFLPRVGTDEENQYIFLEEHPEDGEPPAIPEDGTETMPRRQDTKRHEMNRPWMTEETPYEIRYFTVSFLSDGTKADTRNIAAVSAEEAIRMATELKEAGKGSGYEGNYKYRSETTDGVTRYYFMDCTKNLSQVKRFFSISMIVSLVAFAAIFLLVYLLSAKAIRPIAESYEKQKSFITNASHEIKTPLAVISSCNDVIEMESGESQWTKGIRDQVKRLSKLTSDLVSLSRMEEENRKVEKEMLDLSALLEEGLEPYEMVAQQKGFRFSKEIHPGIQLKANRGMMEQLISILADNAIKYTSEGGTISFSLEQKGKKVVLTEQNDVEEVTPGDHGELLDRFHRGDVSHSQKTPGYGIGLSMAQSIAETHAGTIKAQSPDGKTMVFSVQF